MVNRTPNRLTAQPYPQGLIYSPKRNALIICDTENHAVRLADLGERRTVVTLAGNGSKGRDYRGGRAGSAQPLNSPWDVALDEKEVRRTFSPYYGSGCMALSIPLRMTGTVPEAYL